MIEKEIIIGEGPIRILLLTSSKQNEALERVLSKSGLDNLELTLLRDYQFELTKNKIENQAVPYCLVVDTTIRGRDIKCAGPRCEAILEKSGIEGEIQERQDELANWFVKKFNFSFISLGDKRIPDLMKILQYFNGR